MVYIQLPRLRFEFADQKVEIYPDENGNYKKDVVIDSDTKIDEVYIMQWDKLIEKLSHPVKLQKWDTLSIDYKINVELLW